jgi:hypothetical protein
MMTGKRMKMEGNRMTDERRAYEKAICEVAKVSEIGDVSDGFHTFNSLYEQRMILFAALVKAYRDKAWKSYRHEDGEYCFGGGWFIVGIDTPEGSYTYHYENKYWDMFDCADLPRAKHWDGHTEADAETRLMSLAPTVPLDKDTNVPSNDCISRQQAIDAVNKALDRETIVYGFVRKVAVDSIKTLPSAQPQWIPVTERLPHEEGNYIVTDSAGGVKTVDTDKYRACADVNAGNTGLHMSKVHGCRF